MFLLYLHSNLAVSLIGAFSSISFFLCFSLYMSHWMLIKVIVPFAVYTFCNENEALSAVSSSPESFHVAIVEVMNGVWRFFTTSFFFLGGGVEKQLKCIFQMLMICSRHMADLRHYLIVVLALVLVAY